jgi:hypothetical protein
MLIHAIGSCSYEYILVVCTPSSTVSKGGRQSNGYQAEQKQAANDVTIDTLQESSARREIRLGRPALPWGGCAHAPPGQNGPRRIPRVCTHEQEKHHSASAAPL